MTVDPRHLLADVEPNLAKVVHACKQDPPFEVICGMRTVAEEQQAVATGHSQTMHSRHLPDRNGLAAAVDIAVLDAEGHIQWSPAWPYQQVAQNMKAAAAELGVPLEWGGDWTTLKDYGHFQLPWAQYP